MDDVYKKQQAFEVGRSGMGTAAGGYESERDRGAKERAKAREQSSSAGGGGGLLVILLIGAIGVLIALAVTAALASVVSALVFLGVVRFWAHERLTYRAAYKTSFFAVFTWLVLYAAVGALAIASINGQPGFPYDLVRATAHAFAAGTEGIVSFLTQTRPTNSLESRFPGGERPAINIAAWTALVVPATLASALCFRQIGGPFRGLSGYLKACITSVLVILPGLVCAVWGLLALATGVVALAGHAQIAPIGGGEKLLAASLLAGGVTFGYALVGGVIAAVVVFGVTALLARGFVGTLGRAYGTAVLALLVYGACGVIALYFFRGGDDLIRWVSHFAVGSEPLRQALASQASLWDAAKGFLPLQLLGLLLAGAIVALRTRGPYRGPLGYAMACVLTGAVAFALALPALGVGVLAAKSGGIERIQRFVH